jgi:hypothetical protein
MDRCKACHRLLKDHLSIERKYGPTCWKKRSIGTYQIELRFNPAIDRNLSMKEQHERVKKLLEVK